MVGFAGGGVGVAVGEGAALVAVYQCGADGFGHEPVLPADVEGLAVGAQHDGDEVGVAGQASDSGVRVSRSRP